MIRATLFLFLVLACSRSLAQNRNDTPVVKMIEQTDITSRHIIKYGIKKNISDSNLLSVYKTENAATLLMQRFPVFVRSYGTNGLATLSLRGASASQTAVRWNDIPMQSGTTGLVDLFTIPVAATNSIEIKYGNNGGSIGSGAIGGVLFISSGITNFADQQAVSIAVGAGSYGKLYSCLHAAKCNSRFAVSLDLIAQKATNDFKYSDEAGKKGKLTNAAASQLNSIASIAYKATSKDRFDLKLWLNNTVREIPPALFESLSVKKQVDFALRSSLQWNHFKNNSWNYGVQMADFEERNKYNDSVIGLYSNVRSRQIYVNAYGNLRSYKGIKINLSLPLQWNYLPDNPGKSQQHAAVASSVSFFRNSFSTEVNGRVEAFNNNIISVVGINADYSILTSFKLRTSFGNTYRTPTLNELYYTPGGNPDLNPERGWGAEAGYDWKPKFSRSAITFTHSGTAFYRDIHDWIIWYGGAIWTPHNISEVVSKGLETENKLIYKRAKIIYQLSANATLISSQTMKSVIQYDGSIGHQIPYAPAIITQGNAGFNTRRWRFNYNQTYTGDRYFNSDESGLLPAFSTGNLQVGWLYNSSRSYTADFAFTLQNIWNARYAEVSGRPAPGINLLVCATISYQK